MLKQGKDLKVGDVIVDYVVSMKISGFGAAGVWMFGGDDRKVVFCEELLSPFRVGLDEWIEIEPAEPIGLMVGAGP